MVTVFSVSELGTVSLEGLVMINYVNVSEKVVQRRTFSKFCPPPASAAATTSLNII